MAFVTGMWLLNAPGSALNNRGTVGGTVDNVVEVKKVSAPDGIYPYVSAQAARYWLRTTLEVADDIEWHASPLRREAKVVYTDANPLRWDDDDLFGYMRAPGKNADAKKSRGEGTQLPTAIEGEVTRISPLRLSPLLSLGPVRVARDWGTASRHDGDPVPYEHEFYRAILRGLLSLDLRSAGTFTTTARSGFRNLDPVRVAQAKEQGLRELGNDAYRLGDEERLRRVSSLLTGFARLTGGAKLAAHYTDVTPVALLFAVMRTGNNPFQYAVAAADHSVVRSQPSAVSQAIETWRDQIVSPVYLGWTAGFHDEVGSALADAVRASAGDAGAVVGQPRTVLGRLVEDLARNPAWLA